MQAVHRVGPCRIGDKQAARLPLASWIDTGSYVEANMFLSPRHMGRVAGGAVMALALTASLAAAGTSMTLVGHLQPWENGNWSNIAVDSNRDVAYLGSFDTQGVAVIDTTDPSSPVLTDVLSTEIVPGFPSDSADVDVQGHFLAVSHQSFEGGFSGVSIYDIGPDPHHPTLYQRIASEPVHTAQLDPEVDSGRPYIYMNGAESDLKVTIADIDTGAILSQFAATEGIGCVPSDDDCQSFNFAHDATVQQHPKSGLVLDYIAFWDGGLRIADVTDPANPVEVGAFDYDPPTDGSCCAHDAKPTPSGDWTYLEDEHGVGSTSGVHILDTSSCDGTRYCTPTEVSIWSIPGHPTEGAAVNGFNGFFHHEHPGQGPFGAFVRGFFNYDAHNLDRLGEDRLLVANYTMGIRLVDTSDKAHPREIGFYLPNASRGDTCGRRDCFISRQRMTWGAYFGADGLIYASDMVLGAFVVRP